MLGQPLSTYVIVRAIQFSWVTFLIFLSPNTIIRAAREKRKPQKVNWGVLGVLVCVERTVREKD